MSEWGSVPELDRKIVFGLLRVGVWNASKIVINMVNFKNIKIAITRELRGNLAVG